MKSLVHSLSFIIIYSVLIDDARQTEKSRINVLCHSESFSRSGICHDYKRLRRIRESVKPDESINSQSEQNSTRNVTDSTAEDSLLTSNITVSDTNSTISDLISEEELREELRKIIREEAEREHLQPVADDPACGKLRNEYDEVCFSVPPLAAFDETREFCLAFVKNCRKSLLTNLFTNSKNFQIDFSAYCKKHRERFRFVCPNPLRFNTYAHEAVEFCLRYNERCPKEPIPNEPVQFKRKDADHIYTREIDFWCTREKRTAFNYCTELDLLKVPKYAQFCFLYKLVCIDVHNRVIYG